MRLRIRLARWALIGLLAGTGLALTAVLSASADSGWTMSSFTSAVQVRPDGTLNVSETISADFGGQRKHGIFRDIPVQYDFDAHHYRVLEVAVVSVTDGSEHAWKYSAGRQGSAYEIKIGDPNLEVSGRQTYVLNYTVRGALNAFPDHDELYWNATGNAWGVPIDAAGAFVEVPSGSLQRAACFEGPAGSTTPCQLATSSGSTAKFGTNAPLNPGDGLTVVAALNKGAVTVPPPILERKPRDIAEMFAFDPVDLGLAGFLAGIGIAGVAWLLWVRGRDHVYGSAYYSNHDPATPDQIMPLGEHRPLVVEFAPPDNLRPGQLGLILDESADTKDVTATIIDLATRGFLSIQELPAQGLFGKADYLVKQGGGDVAGLQDYERTIWYGLFSGRTEVKLSDLRGTFVVTLKQAESELYRDAVARRWFLRNPATERALWLVLGIVLLAIGAGLAIVLGQLAGAGLIGVAIMIVGAAIAVSHRRFPHRTAAGRDVFQRTLGFRLYMTTAERYQQQFAEREKIFTAYLPYAIVFGCADRWAHAFRDIDVAAATAGWYAGGAYASPLLFSSSLESFSSTVGSSIAYSPASSGSSGFGGGSGGGFGGGGGGSW